MEYTKGEWIKDNGDSEVWGVFQEEDGDGICYLCEPGDKLLRPGEAEANANLIAASPRMYEALKEWGLWVEGKSSKTLTMIHEMRIDALAKAEGR